MAGEEAGSVTRILHIHLGRAKMHTFPRRQKDLPEVGFQLSQNKGGGPPGKGCERLTTGGQRGGVKRDQPESTEELLVKLRPSGKGLSQNPELNCVTDGPPPVLRDCLLSLISSSLTMNLEESGAGRKGGGEGARE